ncbi:MAG: SpoIIE family protein phosphatase [Vicinamibacterales bacterium]
MADPRLEVNDGLGRRVIPIDKPTLTIGRRTESDVRLVGSDVSREHAEIVREDGALVLKDRGSRYGTFVNGEAVTEHRLVHGDRVQFGRTGGAEVTYLTDAASTSGSSTAGTAVGDIRQMATLLEGLRALGSGRVLDEVLALVLDAAIGVTGAERGFIMLAGDDRQLEMKLARARGRVTLPGTRFDTSRKIPEEVYSTGELKVVQDLLDDHLAKDHQGTVALGIRQVLCTPLRLVRYLDRPDMPAETRAIGVLYLDSREKGQLLSQATRGALDTLANEAGVAIENARLYRETLEKARIEHELRIAAEIQRSLLPQGRREGPFFQAMGASLPSRSIGGDFFEYTDMDDGAFGVVLGDVAGKGPAAALLTAKIQGLFSAQAGDGSPASAMRLVNHGLLKRQIDARYATVFFATLTPDGVLTYCNAGHNPPMVVGHAGVRSLASGSVPVGLFASASYADERTQLAPGDVLVIFSDGVTEALNPAGEEFGEERLSAELTRHRDAPLADILQAVISAVQTFAAGASQSDDVTVLVARYLGPEAGAAAPPS